MFVAVITCALGISCGLSGSFKVPREFASAAECQQQTAAVIQAVGGNPSSFNIVCKRK